MNRRATREAPRWSIKPSAAFGSSLGKYSAIAVTALRQGLRERAAMVGRLGFMVTILLIFSRVWQATFELHDDGWRPERPGDTLWYLAVTEWIVLSQPMVHQDIAADVRSGDVAYRLSRPISYLGSRLAEACGEMALRWLVLGVGAVAMTRALTGHWPTAGWAALWALPVGMLAGGLMLVGLACVGLTSFWLQDCMPVYGIWQKLLFVLGGLMLPLSIYPDWLRRVSELSPFAAMLYGPGRLVFGVSAEQVMTLVASLFAWLFAFVLLLRTMEWQGRRALSINGG